MKTIRTQTVVIVALCVGLSIGLGSAFIESKFQRWTIGDFSTDAIPGNRPLPEVSVAHTTHNFGSIGAGEKGQHTFTVGNNGASPLILTQGTTSCTCTVSDFGTSTSENGDSEATDKKIIAPGEETTVSIQWTGKGTGGRFHQEATVLTNDPRRPEIAFTIEGAIVPTWTANPPDITFPKLSSKSAAHAETTVFTFGDDAPTINSLNILDKEKRKFFKIESDTLPKKRLEEEPEATGGFTLSVDVLPGLPVGPLSQIIEVSVAMPENITIEIPVEGSVTGDISFTGQKWNSTKYQLSLGKVSRSEGLKTRIFLTARGPDREKVTPVVSEVMPKSLNVDIGAAKPIGTGAVIMIPIDIAIPPGSPMANLIGTEQAPKGRIVLQTGLPDSSTLTLPVSVVIGP